MQQSEGKKGLSLCENRLKGLEMSEGRGRQKPEHVGPLSHTRL